MTRTAPSLHNLPPHSRARRGRRVRETRTLFVGPLRVVEGITGPGMLERLVGVEARGVVDPVLDVLLEMPEQALHRPSRGVPERADGMALDLPADLLEHGYLPLVGVALLHPDEYVLEPRRALPARRALAAALVLVEVGEAADGPDHVHRVVEHGDGGGAQAGTLRAEVVELHEGLVALRLVEDGHGRTAGDARLEAVPPVPHPPAVLLDELLKRDGH
mmetsp:Transcript_19846/g.46594  ORF Transcript_19846/g.46594 Transcript_19846/m.46594 type:complete len:218 (+) Transcript_19846:60-713(+)